MKTSGMVNVFKKTSLKFSSRWAMGIPLLLLTAYDTKYYADYKREPLFTSLDALCAVLKDLGPIGVRWAFPKTGVCDAFSLVDMSTGCPELFRGALTSAMLKTFSLSCMRAATNPHQLYHQDCVSALAAHMDYSSRESARSLLLSWL